MKRGLIWGVCLFNMVASSAAIFMVTRPYWRAKSALQTMPAPEVQKASMDWRSDVELAQNYQQLQVALGQVPNDETARIWLAERIQFALSNQQINTDAFALDKLLAQLTRWGQFVSYGSADYRRLEAIAAAPSYPILVRTVALQTLAEVVFRHSKAVGESAGDPTAMAWRNDWQDFLKKQEGAAVGSSLQGQVLLMMDACQKQGLAHWTEANWQAMLGKTLEAGSRPDESSLIAAINLAPTRANHEAVRDVIRKVAQDARSEMLKIAAINALAQIANPDDAQWLLTYPAESVKISQALWAARAQLNVAAKASKESP